MDNINNIKKFIITGAIALACIIGCGVYYSVSVSQIEDKLTEQENQIADLTNQLDVKSNLKQSSEAKLQQDATGLQLDKVSSDNAMIEDFLKNCLTWDSGEEYDAMRAELFEKYGLDENSSFAQVFLPENVKTEDGKYNYIDTHNANSKYEGMESFISRISTDRYSYFTYVDWSSADLNGNEASSTCIFTYDITVDGKLENLNAYTMAD